MKNINDSTIALAGMFQAAYLVKQIAHQGLLDQQLFETLIASVLRLEADSTEQVYAGCQNLRQGFKLILAQFSDDTSNQDFDREMMRYVLGVAVLERKLQRNKTMLQLVAEQVQQAHDYAQDYGLAHEKVLFCLSDLYLDTMSNFNPRIQVVGERRFLDNEINTAKIRVLLLSGVRSAALWRQKGGSKWQILFSRRKIVDIAHKYYQLNQLNQLDSEF